ncbi:MAG: glycosyltransferase, partial [Saprospiraceae bacterium]|nr:glycosyltransferase [Saprospiraceae bacterium]
PLEKTQPSETLRFLFLGRLLNEKGIREYIEAAKMMSEKHPNTHFWILGHIDEQNPGAVVKKSFMQWIRHPAIEYLGFEKDVRNVIRECDVVVLPSYYPEGVPRVLQEGMAMGKPIVTADMPGCREAIDQGVNGILVPPRDAKALFDAFEFFYALSPQERIRMGRAGRMKAISEFDEKISNHQYLELISSILNVTQPTKNKQHKPT